MNWTLLTFDNAEVRKKLQLMRLVMKGLGFLFQFTRFPVKMM